MKKIMMKYASFLLISFMGWGLFSCETHDVVDEIARPGHFAPNVYIEVGASTVEAGDSVEFSVEYWSEDDAFEDVSLWYSMNMELSYELTSVYNTDYSFVLDSTELVREYHEVLSYDHSDNYYDEEKKAYAINDKFPVSYTLTPSEINEPDTYNEEQINRLFPSSVFERFYEGLFETLDYETLKMILVTDFSILDEETFDSHFNETEIKPEEEGDDPEYIYEMKEESAPELLNYLKKVSVEDLIYNEAVPAYGLKFFRGYEIVAKFRVENATGIENFSDEKAVTVK